MGWRDSLALKERPRPALPEPWACIGEDVYTCVPPPGHDPDPQVVAAVREFDPGAIPIWRIQRWRVPGAAEPVTIVHAGIARY